MKNNSISYNRNLLFVGMCIIGIVLLFSCSSTQEEPSKEKAKKDDAKKKEEQKKHKIALIPFDYSFEIGSRKAQDAYQSIAKILKANKKFEPSSMKEWMTENFKARKAPNIVAILSLAKRTGLDIDSFCHGRLFRCGNKYGIVLAVYSLKHETPYYFYRSFLNYGGIDSVLEDISIEMEQRLKVKENAYYSRNLYLRKFKIKFYTYTNLKSGEESIIQLPYININSVSYKINDTFFQDILLYNLHAMDLFTVWNSNMRSYIIDNSITPANMQYDISIDIDISKNSSMLTAYIRNMEDNKRVNTIQMTFDSLDLDDLTKSIRKFAVNLVVRLLKSSELKNVGLLRLNAVDEDQKVMCNNRFIGYGNQSNLLFPVGGVDIRLDSDQYKAFISPFVDSDRYYNVKKSFLLKLKKDPN